MKQLNISLFSILLLLGCGNINNSSRSDKSKEVESLELKPLKEDNVSGVFHFRAYSNGYIPEEMQKRPKLRIFYNDGSYIESTGKWETNLRNQKYDFGYVHQLANGKRGNYKIVEQEIVIEGQRSLFDYGDALYTKPFEKEFSYPGYFLRESVMEVWERIDYNEEYSNLKGKKPAKNETVILF